jgi:hypothetical protein
MWKGEEIRYWKAHHEGELWWMVDVNMDFRNMGVK